MFFPGHALCRYLAPLLVIWAGLTACQAPGPFGSPAETTAKSAEASTAKTIADYEKKADRLEGLFPLLRDRRNGHLYMEVRREQLGKEFIYFAYTHSGVPLLGHFRGKIRNNRVFRIENDFDRLRFVYVDTAHYFNPDSALHRSQKANISPAIFSAPKIVARDEKAGRYLIDADSLFLAERFSQIKFSTSSKSKQFNLGKLSQDKTRYTDIHNYPENAQVIVEYVYDNPTPTVRADEDEGVVDSRFVAIRMQHTLMEMPANDYRPRLDDPRIGYFAEQVTDLTSSDSAPYRDLINRWHLKKKDPGATLSEPVEPIVWWIENTTPHAWRQTIRDAVLAWNIAFEAAGFKNALVVKTQPDDATWDAGDIRYNVLRWTSSPDPPFGGYGPHYANPRTGQILGADIMLEWSFLTSRVRFKSVFSQPATDPEADHCRLCSHLHESQLAGRFHLDAIEAPEGEKKKLIREALHYLILHEVGHTLGLSHNMRSSQLHAPKDLHNTALTRRVGLVGSVMDYPAVNLAGRKQKQGQYYTTRPGPYDVWAIQFGYTPLGDDPARAEAWREKILSRSIEPELAFGNDADDMRWAGKAIDPRVMVRDLSSDAITWSERRIDLIQETLSELQDKYAKAKRSHHDLRTAYYVLLRQHRRATAVLSRYIGGVYVDRAKAHQPGAPVPYHPVPSIEQKRAMTALRRHVFGPNAFARPQKLLQHLRVRRRGFDFSKKTEDPKIHQQALSIQSDALDHLLHPRVVRRITDTRLYGNTYDFGSVMKDLTDAVFADDAKTNVNTFRQNLQTHYLRRVIGLFEDEKKQYDNHARAIALKTLRDIQHRAKRKEALKLNAETQAHTAHLRWLIDRTLHPRS